MCLQHRQKANSPPLIFFTFYMLILISVIVKKIVTINSRLSEIKINSRTITFVPLTVKLVSTNANTLEKARRKYWFHPSPDRPIISYKGHMSEKKFVVKFGFQNGLLSNRSFPCSHGWVYVEKNLRRDKFQNERTH